MNLRNFEQHIDPVILERGIDLYKSGAVLEAEEVRKGIWQAEVEGTKVYNIEVDLSGKKKIERLFCNCPYNTPFCKHTIAALYAIKEVTGIPVKDGKKSKKLSFSELLPKTTVKELRDFVRTYAETDKQFLAQFKASFAYKDEYVDIGEKYTKLIASVIRSHTLRGLIENSASRKLARELDVILGKAQAQIDAGNFRAGLVITQTVIGLAANEVIPNCDPSSWMIADSIYMAINLLETIAHSDACSRELKENLFEFLNTELANSNYFDYGNYGYDLFVIYRYLSGLLGKQSEFFAFIDQLRQDSRHDSYNRSFFVQQKILFYQEAGQEKEADALARQNMEVTEIRKGFVERAINAKNYTVAKQLIDEGIRLAEQFQRQNMVSEWRKMLLQIAELEGDRDTIRRIAPDLAFDIGFRVNYYRQWKATFSGVEWEQEYQRLIGWIKQKIEKQTLKMARNPWWSEPHQLLLELGPVYLEEQQWPPLLDLLKGYSDLDALLQYLPALGHEFPEEMTSLLLPALSGYAKEASNRSGYANLVRTMKQVMKSVPGSREKILELAHQLKAKYPRRPAMADEFNKLK